MTSTARGWVVSALLAVAACMAPASAALPVAGRRDAHHVGATGSAWSYSTNFTAPRPVDRRSPSSDEDSGGSDGGGGRHLTQDGGGVARGSVVDVALAAAIRRIPLPTAATRAGRPQVESTPSPRNSPRPSPTPLSKPKASALASALYIPGRAAAAAGAGEASGYRVWAHGIGPPRCWQCVWPV
jgi:hypothetical protein